MALMIRDIGEHGLIRHLSKKLPQSHPLIQKGIGDDAAVVRPVKGTRYVVTTDMLLEGKHFRSPWASWKDIGFKSMEINLSDLAAMGSQPLFALLSLGLPPRTRRRDVDEFYAGARQSLKPYGVKIIGGDMNASSRGWVISVVMIGQVSKGPLPLRGRAKGGDGIYVSGRLGQSALGYCCLKKGKRGKGVRPFIQRHLRPKARVTFGQKLRPHIHAMIDVSDGLLADLGHILRESHKGAEVWTEAISLSATFIKEARRLRRSPLSLALSGGEDYELLFTAPSRREKVLKRIAKQCCVPLAKVGMIRPRGGMKILNSQGRPIRVQYKGFRHF